MHEKYIWQGPIGKIQRRFLHAYYRELVHYADGVVYVAISGNQVVGYVSLVNGQARLVFRLMLNHPWLCAQYTIRVLLSLQLMEYLWTKIRYEVLGDKWGPELKPVSNPYELRSIAVDPNYRNADVGTALLQAVLEHAQRRNWRPVISWVAQANLPSARLFEKVGFRKIGTRPESDGTVCLYRYDLSCPDPDAHRTYDER